MFNPTNIDEILIQDTHMEVSKGKYVIEDMKLHKFENKLKVKWKSKKLATIKKDEKNPTCSLCTTRRHGDSQCWKMHP
jgi:hypothetical protein